MSDTAALNESTAKVETAPKTGAPTQYKATRIWYEIINSFHESIPLKKHWRSFRTYPDCFSASEAVEWLFRYLKASPNFKSHTSLTRQQAIQLLQIFQKEKIIEDVRASDVKFVFKEFQDDDRLYKFGTNNRFFKAATKQPETGQEKEVNSEAKPESPKTESSHKDTIKSEIKKLSTDEKLLAIKEKLTLVKQPNKENLEPEFPSSTLSKQNVDLLPVTKVVKPNAKETTPIIARNKAEIQKQNHKLFNSKLSDNTNKIMINVHRAESLKRRPTAARSHHYNHGKLVQMKLSKNEEEVWSRVAQKLLESIIRKALTASETSEFEHRSSTGTPLMRYDNKLHNVNRLLYEDGFDAIKVVSGANIHHNCTHVNKHGVVIDTDDDYPAWLIKAMTCLMNWKDEPDEYPPFKDVFGEVNNHFKNLKTPLITPEVACLLRKIMTLLLVPKNFIENTPTFESLYHTAQSDFDTSNHETNKNTFDNLMHNLKTQMQMGNMSVLSSKSNCSKLMRRSFCDEEVRLLETAKLPIIEDNKFSLETEEQKQLIQDIFIASVVELEECCEDCLHKYNALNSFINKNAIEFNEFVSSLNCLEEGEKMNSESVIDPYEFDKHLRRLDGVSRREETEDFEEMLKMKESQERFASLKLKFSPIKSVEERSKTMSKCLSDKRLHRNNSFRTAIGEIDEKNDRIEFAKLRSPSQPANKFRKIGSRGQTFNIANENGPDDSFKRSIDSDENSFTKSLSMNSIQNKIDKNQMLDDSSVNDKKRKLFRNSINSLNKPFEGEKITNESPFTSSTINRNISFDQTNTNKHLLRPMRSYNDLCCSGGFDTNRNLNKYFSQSMNLDTICSTLEDDTNNSGLFKLSNASLNTLGNLLKNSSITSRPEYDRRMFFSRVFSLSSEIESETLCFVIKAFRMCALMLPPTSKRKLHLLLRFLYKLRYDQHSCKHLLENQDIKAARKQASMDSIMEDVQYIDESITNFSMIDNSHQSNSIRELPKPTITPGSRMTNNARDLETKSKAIEKIIIKSFFKSIIPARQTPKTHQQHTPGEELSFNLDLTRSEEEQLAMKLVQILINNYPEIMRIPDELISNVNHKLTASKSSGSLHYIQNSSASNEIRHSVGHQQKISLQQYDRQTAELSKQHLTELLNSILTDMKMSDEEKILRLRKFKDQHPDVYEEKYPTIKKALNILGLNDSTSFLVPNIHLIPKNCFTTEPTMSGSSRRESDYYSLRKRTALAKLTESAKKKTSTSISSYLNQTTIIPSSSTISSSIGLKKFFNKPKKENLI